MNSPEPDDNTKPKPKYTFGWTGWTPKSRLPRRRTEHVEIGPFCWCDPVCFTLCCWCGGEKLVAGQPCPLCDGLGLVVAQYPEDVDLIVHRGDERYSPFDA